MARRTAADTTASESARRVTHAGWRLILDASRRQRAGIALGVACGLAWTAAKVSTGLLVKQAIDAGIETGDSAALRRWTVALGVVAVISALFVGLRRYLAFRAARWIEADLRDRLFAHLQRLHFAFHDEAQTGQLMSRSNTDLEQVQVLLVLIPLTISNGVTVLAVTVILLTLDPLLTLLALGSLPFLNVLATRFSRRLHPFMMGIQRESAELAAVVEQSVAGVRVVKGLGAEPIQAARLRQEADDVYTEAMGAAGLRSRFVPALELLPNIGLIAVLAYGGHQVLAGDLSLGALVAYNVYVAMLIWPLRMLGMIVAQSQRAAVSAARVHEVLSTEPAIADPPRPVALPPEGRGELRFEGVGFSYGRPGARSRAGGNGSAGGDADGDGTGHRAGDARADGDGRGSGDGRTSAAGTHGDGNGRGGARVLDGFDLVVRAGESVALVGATGSGKTTVARLIPRFYDVEAGRILLDGVDIRDLRLRDLRRAIGIVFEDTFLFSDTVAANIAFADPEAPREAVEQAARLAGAHDFVRNLDDGYATRIGERGYSLSGGQRQRLAIARAILADPRVLILDDATSAVDPTKEHEIRASLARVMEGRTTIVIAHRPATIALADRVVLLDGGRVAADGPHDELLATSETYRRVLAMWHAEAS